MEAYSCVATEANRKSTDKPNEDYAFADDDTGLYIILDGVTRDRTQGFYPNPSPAREVSIMFADTVIDYIKECIRVSNDYIGIIRSAFQKGNRAIEKYNETYSGTFLPGTVGIIVLVRKREMFYGFIGDCFGYLVSKEERKEFTVCQTRLIHEHIKEYTASQVRDDICNNNRHPFGYGVLDGREGAMDFVVTDKLSLADTCEIVLATDGAKEIIEASTNSQLLALSAEEILQQENISRDTDDKTIMIIKVGKNDEDGGRNL